MTRWCLVVGAGGPIGSALVSRLSREGIGVVAGGRNLQTLEVLQSEIGPDRVRVCKFDATDQTDVRTALHGLRAELGGLAALVYAAGLPPDPSIPLSDYSLEAWEKTFATYCTGFFLCFQESLRTMMRGGHLLAISSAVTRFPPTALPPLYIGHYAAARAALDEFCKWARRECHQRGMLLSRISPAAVDTPYHLNAPAGFSPPAVVPLDIVVGEVASAILSGIEVDRVLLP